MRDQHDTSTADALAQKRGRPCLDAGQGPLTPAQRAKRYRESRKGDVRSIARAFKKDMPSLLPGFSDAVLLDSIREAIDLGNVRKAGVLVAELARRYPNP